MKKLQNHNCGERPHITKSLKKKLNAIYYDTKLVADPDEAYALLKEQKKLNKKISKMMEVSKDFRGKVYLKEGGIYQLDLF